MREALETGLSRTKGFLQNSNLACADVAGSLCAYLLRENTVCSHPLRLRTDEDKERIARHQYRHDIMSS